MEQSDNEDFNDLDAIISHLKKLTKENLIALLISKLSHKELSRLLT
jgi:secreted Zn-dependent insulinase-like peptidase